MRGLQYVIDLMDKGFGSGIRKAKQNTKGLDDAVNKTNKGIAKIQATGQRSFGGLGKQAKRAGAAIAAALAVSAIFNFGNEVTNLTAKFEGYNNAIEFASGQDGGKNIQFLNDTIKDLNLDMTSSYKGFQTLTGSLKGTALEGKATRDIFEAVGVASTVMNLSAEQSEGAFLALSQMASKGKVQAEELRGQLGERIPGALKIAADSMGMSQQKFNKMLDSGQIYAEDFLPKFAKELKTTFEGGLPKAANSMQAAINRKNNALTSFKIKSGEAFRPLLIGILEAGTSVFGFASDLMSNLQPVKDAFSQVATAFAPFTDAIQQSITPFKQFSENGSLAETVMNGIANGINKAMPLFEFLGNAFAFLYQNLQRVTNALWEEIQGLNESGTAGTYLNNIMDGLVWVFELIQPIISATSDVLIYAIGIIGQVIGVVLESVNALFEWGKQTEWVQRTFNAFSASISDTFYHIRDVVINVLGGVGDLIVGIFTLDTDRIKAGLSKGFDAIKGAVDTNSVIVNGAIKGWNKELEAPIKKEIAVTKKTKANNLTTSNDETTQEIVKALSNNEKSPTKASGKVASVSGGGGNKHITFNIQSFVKELTVQTTNLKENPRELQQIISDIFEESFADIQIRLNNG